MGALQVTRVAAAVLACAGCGRFGFDGAGSGSTTAPDAAIDAAIADVCSPGTLYDTVGQFNGTEVAITVRAAPFAGGYALGIGTDALNAYALHLDAGLVPTETTPHLPLSASYTLWSVVATPNWAFFFVGDTDGTAYLKRLENNFDSYTVAQQVGRFPADPAFAPLGADYLLGAIDPSGNLNLFSVDADGVNGTISVAYYPPATAASVAPATGGVEVAIEASPCEVFLVDTTGATSNHITFAPSCTAPYLSPDGAVVVYERAGQVFRFDIATATTTPLGAGTQPRIAGVAGQRRIAWIGPGSTIAIVGDDGLATTTALNAASVDLVTTSNGVEAVWLDGTRVQRGTTCTH
jgi:hypothetical protein